MALKKEPVKGMKDVMPGEERLREYVMDVIRGTYAAYGFTSIETPLVESIQNLTSKQGGDNEKLIFKILKRGDKLRLSEAKEENDLTDSGLRYDLTVPLVRYYSKHQGELSSPFKALQMGYVFRADRPQKGRFRQFMQCDIDILGEPTNLAEIELIQATTTALTNLGFTDFKVRINDRQILKAIAAASGFPEDQYEEVFITLDKMDKIGEDGVREELIQNGFAPESADKCLSLFAGMKDREDPEAVEALAKELGDFLPDQVAKGLIEIMRTVSAGGSKAFSMAFDPTLVRGMSYYTGTIFEIAMPQYGGSCGGGGRYDKMVGRFTGQDTPACGFSIGFERIIMILMEEHFQIPGAHEKTCFLLEKGMDTDRMAQILNEANALRISGKDVLVVRMNKNKKFQKQQLTKDGYTEFKEFYKNPLQ